MPSQQRRAQTAQDVQTGEQDTGHQQGTSFDGLSVDSGGGDSGANPSEIQRSGSAATKHRDVGIDDALNTGTPALGECTSADMKIKVNATKAAPKKIEGSGTASEADLFTKMEGEGEGVQIKGFDGTASKPTIQEVPHPTAIYINNTPVIDDIHQAAFADCYFLASLGSATAQDPSFVKNTLMGAPGPSITVNLNRWDTGSSTWKPAPIVVDRKLVALKGGSDDGKLVGAGFKVAPQPAESNWWVEVKGDVAYVHRQNVMELGLWAALVEKAYARFAERFGQYGGVRAAAGNSEKSGAGYDDINGGIAQLSYKVLYGGAATIGFNSVNAGPGTDLVATNLAAIRNLLKVSGDASVPNTSNFVMTAGISRDDAVERCDSYTKSVLGNAKLMKKYKSLKKPLKKLSKVIKSWRSESNTTKKQKKLKTVSSYAQSICKPGAYPHLHSDTAEKEFQDLNEHLNTVMLIATDKSDGQRFTYAWHSYSVLGAKFRDADNKALAVTVSNLGGMSAKIDAGNSTVDLRNPHGKNSPNEDGDQDQSVDDGNFTLSFDQFCRSFGFQQHGVVPK
ncbi:MAG: hypothetical protein ACI9MC_000139 [Kiritimatiellia bacterium]|jgi:hypothetical protein